MDPTSEKIYTQDELDNATAEAYSEGYREGSYRGWEDGYETGLAEVQED